MPWQTQITKTIVGIESYCCRLQLNVLTLEGRVSKDMWKDNEHAHER